MPQKSQKEDNPESLLTSAIVTAEGFSRARMIGRKLTFAIASIGVLPIGVIVLSAVFGIVNPRFLTFENFVVISRQISYLGIATLGQMVTILTAGIDLSLGSTVGLSGVIACLVSLKHGTAWGIPAGIGMGVFVGLINGSAVGYLRVVAFMATLAMLSVARGITLTITNGQTIYGLPENFRILGAGYIMSIPIPLFFLIFVLIVTYVLLEKTTFGRKVYAIGGNLEAARLSGIDIKSTTMLVYVYCGALAGLYGVLMASRVNSGPPNLGIGLELDAIGAAVIGGTSLFGGEGKVTKVIFGVIILGILSNGFDMMNVSSYSQMVFKGIIILIAIIMDRYRSRKHG